MYDSAQYAQVVNWGRARTAEARLSLGRALAALSTKLSVATVLGIGAIAVVPPQAVSTFGLGRPAATPAIEIVRPKQVMFEPSQPVKGFALVAARRHRARTAPAPDPPVRKQSAIAVEPEPTPPAPAEAAAEPPKPDVWPEGEVISALRACVKLLAPIAAEVEVAEPVKHEQCGAAAPVLLRRLTSGGNRVEINPPAMLNCAMVAELHAWVTEVVQPAATEVFGSPITRLTNVSGYSCRNRNGSQRESDRLSEHALANAIDISGFVTADGRAIDVVRHWGPTVRDQKEATVAAARAKDGKEPAAKSEPAKAEPPMRTPSAVSRLGGNHRRVAAIGDDRAATAPPPRPGHGEETGREAQAAAAATTQARQTAQASVEGAFLRRLHKGACGMFGTVLGPEANEAHRNHFHLDLAPRRRSAFCE